jgi:hypothetical protein
MAGARRVSMRFKEISPIDAGRTLCQSGPESLGDSIALRHAQRTDPRAKILRNDHLEQTRPPNSCSCR